MLSLSVAYGGDFLATILGFVGDFIKAIITGGGSGDTAYSGVWGSVLTFITTPANAICLIPLVAWLFVLGVSSVRKMYKG